MGLILDFVDVLPIVPGRLIEHGAGRVTVLRKLAQFRNDQPHGVIRRPLADIDPHRDEGFPRASRNPIRQNERLSFLPGRARGARGRGRSFSFFLYYGSLVPLFFSCPIAVRSLSGRLSGCLSGQIADILIFLVITYSYDGTALSGCPSDHLFGFETGQKPLDRAGRPSPCRSELRAGHAKLTALDRDRRAGGVEFGRLPAGFQDKPCPCAKARAVPHEKRVVGRFTVEDGESAHSANALLRRARSAAICSCTMRRRSGRSSFFPFRDL